MRDKALSHADKHESPNPIQDESSKEINGGQSQGNRSIVLETNRRDWFRSIFGMDDDLQSLDTRPARPGFSRATKGCRNHAKTYRPYSYIVSAAAVLIIGGLFQAAAQQPTPAKSQISPDDSVTPRTLEGYVEQEKPFCEYLLKNHPMFKYEKDGRMVGKYHISDRDEEFVDEGGGKDYSKQNNRQVSMTYRLGTESILDLPNRFVGAKKCGDCHPAQYEKWSARDMRKSFASRMRWKKFPTKT